MDFLSYVVKVSICVTLFYCVYWFLFRSSTFFCINRIYLAGALVLSWIIPALDFKIVTKDTHALSTSLDVLYVQTDYITGTSNLGTPGVISEYNWLNILYWVIALTFFCRLIHACFCIVRLRNKSKRLKNEKAIFQACINEPFTFGNWVFLPNGHVNPIVLQHEMQHVRRRHFIDLLLLEISAVLLWFNPVMIMYRRSIKMQHEYEADGAVAKTNSVETYLEALAAHLQRKSIAGPFSFFYSTHLKQRILMMTKKRTSPLFTIAYTLTGPIVFALILNLSTIRLGDYDFAGDSDGMTIILDAGHGGNDSGTEYDHRTNEKELALSLAKAIEKEAKAQKIRVVMTRNSDEGISLEDRVKIARQHKADVFISLHVNSNKENPNASGISCLISDRNERFDESRQIAEKLMNSLSGMSGLTKNEVSQSSAYVLSKNPIPAVILEVGYLTNESDYAFLTSPEKVKVLAERVISALKRER